MNDIAFAGNSETSFKFPLSIVYSQAKDPNGAMLRDIADRCGFTGNRKTEIQVKYTITVRPSSTYPHAGSNAGSRTAFDSYSRRDHQPKLHGYHGLRLPSHQRTNRGTLRSPRDV